MSSTDKGKNNTMKLPRTLRLPVTAVAATLVLIVYIGVSANGGEPTKDTDARLGALDRGGDPDNEFSRQSTPAPSSFRPRLRKLTPEELRRSQARDKSFSLYSDVSTLLNTHKLVEAYALLNEAIELEEFALNTEVNGTRHLSATGQSLRADLLLHYGRPQEALSVMENVSLTRGRERAIKAICYYEQRMYDECEELLPASEIWDIAGGLEEIARACFLEECTTRELGARIYCLRGDYSRSVGDAESATHYFEHAVELDSTNEFLLYELGTSLMIVGRHGEALRYLEQILPSDDYMFQELIRSRIYACRWFLGLPN